MVKTVAYCHPLVPCEWIESHGLRSRWIVPRDAEASAGAGSLTGMCPYARAVVDSLASSDEPSLAVLTTACDQMRRGAGLLAEDRPDDVFLLHVPKTRGTPGSRAYYGDELRRLGRWLVAGGGNASTADRLAEIMARRAAARDAFRRGETPVETPSWCNPIAAALAAEMNANDSQGAALGLVGGPLRQRDLAVARWIRAAGGRIALDATCGGYRTLAGPIDPAAVARDPFEELVRIYFDHIPTIFERPGDRLYAWLAGQVAARQVRGLLCLRHVWCDLWHAALPRLKETAGVPILELDLGDEDHGGESRLRGRLEAMIESLSHPEPR
ncbi:MAG: 2-hydroxyacyl-CoA dehydratase [Pirellulales bacterium]|nr:2-hydroxyacyl-CoA dehydratase [Pirellulales bacterium]